VVREPAERNCVSASSFIPGDADPWAFLILGSLAAMLISAAKAGFGGSMGLLAVPIMIYACRGDAMLANGIFLPLLIFCDYFAMCSWWRKWNRRAVALLVPGAVIGVAMGWAALWAIRRLGVQDRTDKANAALMLSIGLIAVGFVILQAARALRANPIRFRPVLWQATGIGAAAWLTSTLAHAAGPVISMYMLPQAMPKGRFVASTVLYYWIGNQIKLVPYFALGLIHTESLGASVSLLPAVIAGVALGVFLHHRIGDKQFTGLVYVLLGLAGSHMIFKACKELWA